VTTAVADGGTYADPTTESPLAGPALAEHVRALLTAFPDLNFEVVSCQPADVGTDGTMVVQWLMRGTNTGSLRGLIPTGRTVTLPGVDVITSGTARSARSRATSTGRRWLSSSGFR
jgi:SnoaL-like polyketide cyclase